MKFEFVRLALLLAVLALVVSCRSRNNYPSSATPPAEVPPAEYGVGPDGTPLPPPGQEGAPGGRFGYSGTTDQPPPPPPPAPGGTSTNPRDVRDMNAPGGSGTVQAPSEPSQPPAPPKPSGPPSSSEMAFANPVPGNPLVVTLPGGNQSLGQISIEKYDSAGNPTGEPLKRGTQVQIPDPNNPGQKIYFKVP
ncbi:MAG: hypothetical protein AAGC68_04815 [Verrucomicrobiota bacterium]